MMLSLLSAIAFIFLLPCVVETFRLSSSSTQKSASLNKKFNLLMTNEEVNSLVSKIRQATPPKSIVVIKYGGHAMENDELKNLFCQDIATLCKVCI